MKKDGKYRFSLQFSESSEEKKRAGELLERLGNRKSAIVVDALNEYLLNHPELTNEDCKIEVIVTPIERSIPENLEQMIRDMIEERVAMVQSTETVVEGKTFDNLEEDVAQMLNNLDFFQ